MGTFQIKVNHRKLLDGIFAVCQVPAKLFVPICSAVDKLDKLSWLEVRAEMTTKGLDENSADAIWAIIQQKGSPKELLTALLAHPGLGANASAKEAIADLELLLRYTALMGAADALVIDLSLARGLGYYTGVIFEAVLTDSTVHVGSVGGGGR